MRRPYTEILKDLALSLPGRKRQELMAEFQDHPKTKTAHTIAGGWMAVSNGNGRLDPTKTAAYIRYLLANGTPCASFQGRDVLGLLESLPKRRGRRPKR